MKIGINSWSLPSTLTLEEMFKITKKYGYDTIELNMSENKPKDTMVTDLGLLDSKYLTLDTTIDDIKKIKKLSDDYDLPISSISTSLHWEYPLNHPNKKIREKGKDIVRKMIIACHELGGDTVLVVPGIVTETMPYDECYKLSLEAFIELAPLAEQYNIQIGIENVWNKFLLSPLEMKLFVETINHPLVGVYFDVGNILQFGYPDQWIHILNKHIFKIHVKDFDTTIGNIHGFKNLLAGDLNWPKLISALKFINYQGPLTAEISPYNFSGTQLAEDTANALKQIVSY